MTNNNNPWAGLASYEDPSKSVRKLKFCGRDNEIYDVTRLIDDNLLVVLYGKSGVGKTSLLNAGVFPKLRFEQYLPVSIRLGTLEAKASYQDAIITVIEKAIEELHGSITVFNVVEEQTDNQQPDRLWNYFAKHRFFNSINNGFLIRGANFQGAKAYAYGKILLFPQLGEHASVEQGGLPDAAFAVQNQQEVIVNQAGDIVNVVVAAAEYQLPFAFGRVFVGGQTCPWVVSLLCHGSVTPNCLYMESNSLAKPVFSLTIKLLGFSCISMPEVLCFKMRSNT